MNKLVIVTFFLTLLIIACSGQKISNEPTTLEELKQKKITNPSEYDKCLKEVEETEQKYEECIQDMLNGQGYDDGIDCIENFDEPICEDIDRYNAEVNATNECQEQIYDDNTLTMSDCMELIGKSNKN